MKHWKFRIRRPFFLGMLWILSISDFGQQYGAQGSAPKTLTEKTPTFEIASIRPHMRRPGELELTVFNADGFTATNAAFREILLVAYGIDDPTMWGTTAPIPGSPSWVQSDFYDIKAKMSDAEAETLQKLSPEEQREQKRLMLQSLLAERLNLKVHLETKEAPCYALVIARNGPKNLKEAPKDTKSNSQWSGWNHVEYQAFSIPAFVSLLSGVEQCQISDRTGLTGKYDFTFTFARDTSLPGRDVATTQNSSLPSVFTALQEQLGLKLQRERVQVQSIVIDHIDRPSEN